MRLAIPSVAEPALERYTTLSNVESEDTWNGRVDTWQGALDVFAAHPILGVGTGNYAEAAMGYSESVQAHSERKEKRSAGATHNVFLGCRERVGARGADPVAGDTVPGVENGVADRPEVGPGNWHISWSYRGHDRGYDAAVGDEKIVYVFFGSVLALQLHDSTRGAPSVGKHERRT